MSDLVYREKLKSAYSDTKVSDSYIRERFDSSLGRILHEAQVRFVADCIRERRVGRVLEMAPGPARLTVDIGLACPQSSGIIVDANANMLDQAGRRLKSAGLAERWATVVGDAFALPLEERFELVYSFRFIRHFEEAERVKLYRQVHEHLQSGGLFIMDAINRRVSAPLRAKSPDAYPIYDELYDLPQLKREMEANGFRVIRHLPVQHSFSLLNLLQIWIAPRSQKLAYLAMRTIEALRLGEPLEWIVLCRKV